MPLFEKSRYWNSTRGLSLNGEVILTERLPYYFKRFPDNIEHKVISGDTFQSIAYYYYNGTMAFDRSAAELFWVVADFQPVAVHDVTLALEPGTTVYVPSLRVLEQEILGERRQ
jgi:hypothetical protein